MYIVLYEVLVITDIYILKFKIQYYYSSVFVFVFVFILLFFRFYFINVNLLATSGFVIVLEVRGHPDVSCQDER